MVNPVVKIPFTSIPITAESPVPIIPIIQSPPPHKSNWEVLAATPGHCQQFTNNVNMSLHASQLLSTAFCVPPASVSLMNSEHFP